MAFFWCVIHLCSIIIDGATAIFLQGVSYSLLFCIEAAIQPIATKVHQRFVKALCVDSFFKREKGCFLKEVCHAVCVK